MSGTRSLLQSPGEGQSLNLFVCSSLSLYASPQTPSAGCPGPSAGGSRAGQPDATLAAVAGRRRFNGALVRRRRSVRATLASGSPLQLLSRGGALPRPRLALASLSQPQAGFLPPAPAVSFATTEGSQKSGNWGRGDDTQAHGKHLKTTGTVALSSPPLNLRRMSTSPHTHPTPQWSGPLVGGGSLRVVARVAPRCTWLKPHLGSGPQDGKGGREGWVPTAQASRPRVLWAALPQPTGSVCVCLSATVSGFLWKREGG